MNTLLVILLIYLAGYAVSFLWLFLGFDDHKLKFLKADAMFSLCSWIMVVILIIFCGITYAEEACDQDNEN